MLKPSKRVLILGGTLEGRELAHLLLAKGWSVTTSFAGATEEPILPPGTIRSGGFGGFEGLAAYLRDGGYEALADATHPYATQISSHAAAAAAANGIRYVRLERPAWLPLARDNWIDVVSAAEAALAIPRLAHPLVTVGRKEIAPFLARRDVVGIARMIEEPQAEVPPNWTILRSRPPFTFEEELALMAQRGISHLVTKNSGGELMRAKLDAARERKIPVIMVARPCKPAAPTAPTAQGLADLLNA